MMRFLRVLAFSSLITAALAFAATTYFASDWNWRPVEMPMPGANVEIEDRFEIANGGNFELEVSVPTPIPSIAMEDMPPVACDLRVAIRGPAGFAADRNVSMFRLGGRSNFDLYHASELSLPARGRYEIRLANRGVSQPFGERGAMIALTRYEQPTEAFLRALFLRYLGWAGLVFGMVFALASELMISRGRSRAV